MKARSVIAALVAFWLAFGPLVSAWAQYADAPCDSMSMSMPASDCCGEGTSQAKCLNTCLAVSPAMAAPVAQGDAATVAGDVIAALAFRHVSVLAPPDIAPPKPLVS